VLVVYYAHKEHTLRTSRDIDMDRFMKISEVIDRVGLSRSGIYLAMKQGDFPKQFKVRGSAARWSSDEVEAWMDARKENR
jgi:Predicted transcriptional regulator